MIVVIPDCPFRRFDSNQFCAHEANAGRTITLRDCQSCQLLPPTSGVAKTPEQHQAIDLAEPVEWPLLARIVRRMKDDTDVGVGDTIHRQLGLPGAWFESAMTALSLPCGCADRRAYLNRRFPYVMP